MKPPTVPPGMQLLWGEGGQTFARCTRDARRMEAWAQDMHLMRDEAIALLAGQRTCDSEVAGSSPGWASFLVGAPFPPTQCQY